MAEVLRSFETTVTDESGTYHPRVVGRQAEDGMWEGWLEFVPLDGGGEILVGPIESRQPEYEHLVYWSSGLTPIYLEGSLHRARRPVVVRPRVAIEEPPSDLPAPRVVAPAVRDYRRDAVLDPFDVASHGGLDVLAQELRALNRPRLVNIIAEFDLNPAAEDLAWMSDMQLARFIVVAVEAQLLQRSR